MKLVKQFAIVFIIFQAGVKVSALIRPVIFIPGSIMGMIFLFALLMMGIIKLEMIEDLSKLLLGNMGLFFIPLGVSLLKYTDILASIWIKLAVTLIVTNIIVMFAAGKTADIFMGKGAKERG